MRTCAATDSSYLLNSTVPRQRSLVFQETMQADSDTSPSPSRSVTPVVQSPQRSEIFYMDFVTFQVEDTLFKVPKLPFIRGSSTFRAMFSLPQIENVEGSSDMNPLKLEGIDKVDFERLLTVMYPYNPSSGQPLPDHTQVSTWVSVLKLSEMWNFYALHALAVKKLTSATMDPLDRIVLGKRYKIPQWLRTGYTQLIQRDTPLTDEEGAKVDLRTAMRISRAREDNLRYHSGHTTTSFNNTYASRYSVEISIEKIFGEELKVADLEFKYFKSGELIE